MVDGVQADSGPKAVAGIDPSSEAARDQELFGVGDDPEGPAEPVRLDLTTPLETLLMLGQFAGGTIALVLLWLGLVSFRNDPHWAGVLPYSLIPIGVFLVCRWLGTTTDNFYLLDPATRTLLYHFDFLGFRRATPTLRSEEILGIGVQGVYFFTRGRSRFYRYGLCCFTTDGRIFNLTDVALNDPTPGNRRARYLARQIGCRVFPCLPEHRHFMREEGLGNWQVAIIHEPLSAPQPGVPATGEESKLAWILLGIFLLAIFVMIHFVK